MCLSQLIDQLMFSDRHQLRALLPRVPGFEHLVHFLQRAALCSKSRQ